MPMYRAIERCYVKWLHVFTFLSFHVFRLSLDSWITQKEGLARRPEGESQPSLLCKKTAVVALVIQLIQIRISCINFCISCTIAFTLLNVTPWGKPWIWAKNLVTLQCLIRTQDSLIRTLYQSDKCLIGYHSNKNMSFFVDFICTGRKKNVLLRRISRRREVSTLP